MDGSKASVSDNTATTIVTFTADTGPSGFTVQLTFVGQSEDTTDSAVVGIMGFLMVSRNSTGTVTAEWVETFNDNHTSGSATFGTCEVTTAIATADVQVKAKFDSTLNQSWTVLWTALMSHDVTVTEA
jgi:hypothetical protein